MNCHLTPYRQGIYTLDAGYERPLMASIHLIVEQGRVALVDTGINASLPFLRAALAQLGLTLDCVDWVLLTHVHLDHAGGAGLMMQHCPNAKMVVHSRGSRHMADPTKLMAGTIAVYGEAATRRLYGEPVPVPLERMVEPTDGMTIHLADRAIQIFDSPGHAKHHVCFWDAQAKAVFTGDTFGISYREMDEPSDGDLPRQFIFTTTTPVHFEPQVLIQSIERIMSLAPEVAYLTHFGELRQLPEHTAQLKAQIKNLAALAEKHQSAGSKRHALIKADLSAFLIAEAKAFGSRHDEASLMEIWAGDIELDTQGLVVWLDTVAKH